MSYVLIVEIHQSKSLELRGTGGYFYGDFEGWSTLSALSLQVPIFMESGWIKLYRTSFDNPYYFKEKFTKWQAWVDILLITNHEKREFDIRGNTVVVDRGQFAYGEQTLAKRWNWSRMKVRRFLSDLETRQQIVQQKNRVLSLYTVINYERHQSNDTTDKTTDDTTESPQTRQQKNINKNDKNYKNDKENTNTNVLAGFGNPEVNEVCAYFLEKMKLTREDVSKEKSRRYWNTLLKEDARGIEGVKKLIDLAAKDPWYKKNIASSMDLFYKRIKLEKRAEDQPKTIVVRE